MSEVAITIQNVSKCFKRYRHPVDRLKELLFPGKQRADEFWALRDISLDIPKGKTLGIVGANGSGKSTLLQIIVGTLAPTTGHVNVQGRISALLELGSGFNPEFTGRQNIFFNGQVLGLTQRQIEDKYDDIVAFADIGDFIDQPVKTYSSGMFVRLAFAVATSVEPDILVVDEALAVGDEAFQRKCYARLEKIQDRGGTILFVSHSAGTVIDLCDSAVLMSEGELLLYNTPKYVIDKYHKLIYAPTEKIQTVREELRRLNHKQYQQNLSQDTITPNLTQNIGQNSSGETQQAGEVVTEKTAAEIINELPTFALQSKPFYDPNLKPAETLSYLSRGAKISNPQILTRRKEPVNNLIGRDNYIYTYEVEFLQEASKVRFGMLVKTIKGSELGGASYRFPEEKLEDRVVKAGTKVVVKFIFNCLLNPGVYFLNAGVSGIVNGQFTYLARCIDVGMFRVLPEEDSDATGIIDFMIKPSLSVARVDETLSVSPEIEILV
jgi:lipopolysaccharide transport system ATP-binding protein